MPRNPRFNVVWTLVREHDEIVRFNLSDLLEEITGPADAESILKVSPPSDCRYPSG